VHSVKGRIAGAPRRKRHNASGSVGETEAGPASIQLRMQNLQSRERLPAHAPTEVSSAASTRVTTFLAGDSRTTHLGQ
jgi:hypothetical protein